MRRHVLASLAFGLVAGTMGAAVAQTSPPSRLRATIDSVTATTLTVTPRNGSPTTLALPSDVPVAGVSIAKIGDIKPGSYIGTAAAPQPDGTQKALEVHVFPPSMAGSGEGFRPWDSAPNSTMTNGTVGDLVGSHGRTLTVKYQGGEKTVIVPEDVPIVSIEPGSRALLTPGAHVIVFASKDSNGTLTAMRILAGEKGLTPPM
ncbi:MAG TPA: hypothetical protein VGC09_09965 [Rhodopila sp.]